MLLLSDQQILLKYIYCHGSVVSLLLYIRYPSAWFHIKSKCSFNLDLKSLLYFLKYSFTYTTLWAG